MGVTGGLHPFRDIQMEAYNLEMRLRALLVLAFSVRMAFAADPKWIRVPSDDFEIYSSASEGDTRRALEYFERVRSFFEQMNGAQAADQKSPAKKAEPVRVIVFGSKKEYQPYSPNDFAAAFYTRIADRDYIVLGGSTDDVFPTAVHEYVHLIVQHYGLNLPPWLNEGIAEVYSTMKPVGKQVLVGSLIPGRMYGLAQDKWVPLSTIVAATKDSAYYNERSKAGSLYDEGWALAHMLELSNEYAPRFPQLLEAIQKGTPSQQAIETVYGKPLLSVEKDLQAYLRRSSFNARLVTLKLQDGPKVASEPAPMFDIKLSLIEISNRPGRADEIGQKLRDLAGEYPQRPEPQASLGYLALRQGHSEDAVAAFGRAIELGSRDAQMLWDYGRMAANSQAEESMHALDLLLKDQPARLDVRMLLAQLQLRAKQPAAALESLRSVHSVKAEDASQFFQLQAMASVQAGDYPAAKANALRWIEYTKSDQERENARNLVQFVDRNESAKSSGARPPAAPAMAMATPIPQPDDARPEGPPELKRRGTVEQLPPTPAQKLPYIAGDFVGVDCSGDRLKFVLATSRGRVPLLVERSEGMIDLKCGEQKPTRIWIEYQPAGEREKDAQGFVRTMHFDPEPAK
jgi:tetratricopeptide (TPR) repeat protein